MIRVRNANGYTDVNPSVTLTATAELTSISPEVGSIYGGLEVQIAGSGFHPTATIVNVSSLTFLFNFYRPQRSCDQGYVFIRVCDSVNGGGLWQGDPPGRETPPSRETPRQGGTPQQGEPPGRETPRQGEPPPARHMVNEWPVHILLECILVNQLFFNAMALI